MANHRKGGSSQDRRRERRATERAKAPATGEPVEGVEVALGDTATLTADGLGETLPLVESTLAVGQGVDALAALESVRQAFAAPMDGDCADCGHAADEHAGSLNEGACSADGCSCEAMVEAHASTASLEFRPSDEVVEAAVAALTLDAPDAVVPLVRLRLRELALSLAVEDLPAEHQPGEELPAAHPSPAAPPTEVERAGGGLRWTAAFVPEGVLTEDGRAMAPGSLTWRDLPLTLMAMVETAEGHDGAEVSGRIDRIWRDGATIRGEGVFDVGEYGSDIARMVADQTLRGISVDIAVLDYVVGPKSDWFDADGNWAPREDAGAEPTLEDILFGGGEDLIYVVTNGVIGAVTVCPFPAFADASITLAASLVAASSPAVWTATQQAGFVVTREPAALVASAADDPEPEEGPEALTASAAGLAPLKPPSSWFSDPGLAELTPIQIDDEGRVFGHAWAWESCHTAYADACVVAPHSSAAYAYFHLGELECEDGERVAVGKVTIDAPHAGQRLSRTDATRHYDDTGTVAAHVVCGEDEHGGWVSGAIDPDLSEAKLRLLRGSVLSGDWRDVNGNLELVALLAVNVPGFPVPRVRALVAAGADGAEVRLALVAAGIRPVAVESDAVDAATRAKLRALGDRAQGRFAALASRALDAA